MYRNVYDTDVTTWSPQGRLHQVEYAMEAVKLGTCGVGLKSKTHVVLAGFKRSLSKLASYNTKIMKVDDHIGVVFSGITADAMSQINTQKYSKRPFGCGLIVGGVDGYGCQACAFGTRSQSARTYLENHYEEFADASIEDLITHAIMSLKNSLAQDQEICWAGDDVERFEQYCDYTSIIELTLEEIKLKLSKISQENVTMSET